VNKSNNKEIINKEMTMINRLRAGIITATLNEEED
jgi:hypothetical protein